MADMLVNLLPLPAAEPLTNVTIRRANPWEAKPVIDFARTFSDRWADEVSIGFTRQPVTVFIATKNAEVVGVCAYECTRRDFLGPMGVLDSLRGRGIGKQLVLSSLNAMKELGYVYAIIGGVGPADFYAKTCGATIIPDSVPGIYTDRLK